MGHRGTGEIQVNLQVLHAELGGLHPAVRPDPAADLRAGEGVAPRGGGVRAAGRHGVHAGGPQERPGGAQAGEEDGGGGAGQRAGHGHLRGGVLQGRRQRHPGLRDYRQGDLREVPQGHDPHHR